MLGARFLTRDPLEAIARSPYAYAANDPINRTDPTGLCPMCLVFLGGAAIGGGLDLGFQVLGNVANGCGALSDIDWGSVAFNSLLGGAFGVGGAWIGSGRAWSALRNVNWADDTGAVQLGKWMSPDEFADDLIRQTRNLYRGTATETGRHGAGLRAAARDLRDQARTGGYLPEIVDRLLNAASRFEARARGIDHPGGMR